MRTLKKVFILMISIVMLTACSKSEGSTDTNSDAVQETGMNSASDAVQESGMNSASDAVQESEQNINSGVDVHNTEEVADNTKEVLFSNNEEKDTENTQEDNTIRLVMVGDILLHTRVSDSAHLDDGTYDYNPVFAHTSDIISEADIALVNEEVIIGGEELGVSGYPSFNAPYAIGDALVENGFDVILHATNHAMDKGKRGLQNCMSFWYENYPDIAVLGIHDSEEAQNDIFYYEQNGIKIAILNYTYGTNGISLPGDMPWSVDLLDKDKVISDLSKAEENADFTVVCPHWGTEYNLGISEQQKKWTKIFVENGADLIIGTHPHVIEPVEWYEDENTGNKALVYYSLGNFVNWTSGTGSQSANRMVGGMADVTLKMDNGNVAIDEYTVHGLVCHLAEGTGNVTTYQIKDYSKDLADDNMMRAQDPNFSYEYCIDLCNRIWSVWE